jgi:hypothetical protein
MFDLYEMFRRAQGGGAFDNLARAYGMSPEQMQAAVAALTPAFARGFQRQSDNDEAARCFAELLQTETYARAFDAQAAALDPASKSAGEDALAKLFGSKEVSRAVAAQAAAASGVQAEIIRKVLPVLASILVGGFMKAARGAAPAGGGFADQIGGFWSEIMRQAAGGSSPDATRADAAREAGPGRPHDAAATMMGDMMAEMLGAAFGRAKPAPQAAPEPPEEQEQAATPPPPQEAPFDDLMRTGREFSAQNAQAMERIFDAFFGRKSGA